MIVRYFVNRAPGLCKDCMKNSAEVIRNPNGIIENNTEITESEKSARKLIKNRRNVRYQMSQPTLKGQPKYQVYIIRPHCQHAVLMCGLFQRMSWRSVVCFLRVRLYVGHYRDACKNDLTDRDAIWEQTFVCPRNHVLDGSRSLYGKGHCLRGAYS